MTRLTKLAVFLVADLALSIAVGKLLKRSSAMLERGDDVSCACRGRTLRVVP